MFSDALPCSARNSHCLLPGLHLQAYNPSTIDINSDAAEMSYWISILQNQIPQVVEKAAASESSTPEAQRRASAFGRALDLHLTRLRCVALLSRLGAFVKRWCSFKFLLCLLATALCRNKPGAYGQLDLADLFELREQCLREFGFADIYRRAVEPRAGLGSIMEFMLL